MCHILLKVTHLPFNIKHGNMGRYCLHTHLFQNNLVGWDNLKVGHGMEDTAQAQTPPGMAAGERRYKNNSEKK